jgi:predicted  nucleic acid-binding Zn-ribbon protein
MYPSRRRNPSPHRPPELVKKQGVEIERLREAANKFETELLQVKEEKATQQKHLEELEATLAKVEAEYAQEIDEQKNKANIAYPELSIANCQLPHI